MTSDKPWGLVVIGSDLVERDTLFLIDGTSTEWQWELYEAPVVSQDGKHRVAAHVEIVGKQKVVETNPLHWHRPHHLRGFVRLFGSVIGYYYRKVTGKLRHYESINAVKLVGLSS